MIEVAAFVGFSSTSDAPIMLDRPLSEAAIGAEGHPAKAEWPLLKCDNRVRAFCHI